jgi:DNA topoisomerase-2
MLKSFFFQERATAAAPMDNKIKVLPEEREKQQQPCKKKLEDVYKKMDPIDHVLHRPDTYVGPLLNAFSEEPMWIANKHEDANGKRGPTDCKSLVVPPTISLENRIIKFSKGLYKIFDEILVNAADNKQRMIP